MFITATQPAFGFDANKFKQDFAPIEPLLSQNLLGRFRRVAVARVQVTLPPGWAEVSVDEVADEVAREARSTLCIVNTRCDAAALYAAVKARVGSAIPVYHLSASMCSDHRSKVLADIRQCLGREEPVKVVSTQVSRRVSTSTSRW